MVNEPWEIPVIETPVSTPEPWEIPINPVNQGTETIPGFGSTQYKVQWLDFLVSLWGALLRNVLPLSMPKV
jgi:hypothetical protein